MDEKVYQIAVIGGGAAGVMAALRGTLNNKQVLFFPGSPKNKKKSRAQWVSKVENMPGYSQYKKGIVQPHMETIKEIEEGHFKHQFFHQKNRGIESIEKKSEVFHLTDNKGDTYHAQYVVLATGLMDVQPIIQGEISPVFPYANNQLIEYCLRCDGHHTYQKELSVIGHSNVAHWVAILLKERYELENVHVLLNGNSSEVSESTEKIVQAYQIQVHSSPIKEILGQPKDLKLEGFTLEDGTQINSQIAYVSLGMIVYNDLAKQLGAELDDRGFVITNEKGETNIENLYATGDLRAGLKKQIYTAWDSAVDSLDDIDGKIRKHHRSQTLGL